MPRAIFPVLLNETERESLRQLAARLRRTQSDTVRQLIIEAELKSKGEELPCVTVH